MRSCSLASLDAAPGELRHLRRTLSLGDQVTVSIDPDHDARWTGADLTDVILGAGFVVDAQRSADTVTATMIESIGDTVRDDMRILVVGLNPSPTAAASGVGFAHPSNRFWPAALAAGCASRDRDPDHALRHHGMGMTDLVKRTTARAAELDPAEFADGVERLERLVARHQPGVTCIVGLTGWRQARDRHAQEGAQPKAFGGRPLHVIGNPSGLNAHQTVERCAQQLRDALVAATAH